MIWRCDLVPQYLALESEIGAAIHRVLKSGRYILAEELQQFEDAFASYLGADHVIGVANGTDGLTLALQAAGVGSGDEVITTPFTAIPTVAAIVDAGARPVFVDICADTFLMDIGRVPAAVTERIEFYSRGWTFETELVWTLQDRGARVVEVPISLIERTGGSSKIGVTTPFQVARDLVLLRFGPCSRRGHFRRPYQGA